MMAKLKSPDTPRRKCPWGTRHCIFTGSRPYREYVERLKKHPNAVDGTFYDVIKLDSNKRLCQL